MITEVDEALIDSLRKGLSKLVPSENIALGEVDPKKGKCLALANTDFVVEELGIGGSAGVKREEVTENIKPDGVSREFNLSGKPLRPIIGVERPIGTTMTEPDGYKIDYSTGKITFRAAPAKGESIRVRYYLARSIAEVKMLKLALTYYLTIWADDPREREDITLEAIKALYSQATELGRQGIGGIKLIKGTLVDLPGDLSRKARRIEYRVEADIAIELPQPPIERIEIGAIEDDAR